MIERVSYERKIAGNNVLWIIPLVLASFFWWQAMAGSLSIGALLALRAFQWQLCDWGAFYVQKSCPSVDGGAAILP